MSTDEALWRLGHRSAPLDFVPRALCGWQHRWDDPEREYRTLYGASSTLTCLREVLADLRPNAKAIAELRELFGDTTPAVRDAGALGRELLEAHLLCPARAVGDGDLCDISQVRSKDRIVTQTIGRSLFGHGYAGVAFGSNLDDPQLVQVCAEFELTLG